MDKDIWIALYTQLNERSRWYTSQLWYISLAYIAVIGLGLEISFKLPRDLSIYAFIVLTVLSLAIFVQVVSIRHHICRNIKEMQKLENIHQVSISTKSNWILSFSTYMKIIPIIVCISFILIITERIDFDIPTIQNIRSIALLAIVMFVIFILIYDFLRD